MKPVGLFVRLSLVHLVLCLPAPARAGGADSGWMDRISQGFSCRIRVVGFGMTAQAADSDRNPDNRIMNLPQHTAALQVRPDLRLDLDRLSLSLQPRAELYWESWTRGPREGEDEWRDETYVHQWLARWRCTDALYASYGRENLQWGPAHLTSLSNPFIADNGKSNPIAEVAAADFARVVWVPALSWSLSLIVNTQPGRREVAAGDFKESYALKADYTGSADYGSLILTYKADAFDQVSGYYGRTASDALLVYAEGVVQRDPSGRYAREAAGPLGYAMAVKDRSDPVWIGSVLAGAAYTLESGPTLTLEYLCYGPGYDSAEARNFFELQARAAGEIRSGSTLAPLGMQALGAAADPGLRFLRRNYVMLQFGQTDIADVINVTLRCTRNLDDASRRWTAIGEWYIGDHVKLFAIGVLDDGSQRSEFGDIIDYEARLGVMLIF